MISKNKNSKKELILPIFLGLIMILSILGYSLTSGTNDNSGSLGSSNVYNGKEYIRTQQGWAVNIGEGYVTFNYHPNELEDILIPAFQLTNKVYIGYDADNKDQNIDFIIQKLNNFFFYRNTRPVNACIKDSVNCPNIPIVDCNSKDKSITVEKQDKLEIKQEGSCLHIKGTSLDLDKATEKLVMQQLGLI